MTRRAAAVILFLALSACGSSPTASVTQTTPPAVERATITVAGHAFPYRLYHPERPTALILMLHDCDHSGDAFATLTHFDDQAKAAGVAAVYPGASGCWNEFLDPGSEDDLAFLTQLIDQLTATLAVDKNHVFVAGFQSGGHMAYTLLCNIPERIAAIASVSGGMPLDSRRASMNCSESALTKPVSILEIHGTADDFIPYEGGGGLGAPATPDLLKYWAARDGCTGDPSATQNGITKSTVWQHCAGNVTVRLDTVTGGHNTWFGSTFEPVAGEPDANRVVWDFFNTTK